MKKVIILSLFFSVLSWADVMIAMPEVKESVKKTFGATYRYAAYYPKGRSTSEKVDDKFWERITSEYTVEPIVFGGTYFILDLGAKKFSENDSVKQFTQNVPPFVGENIKFALAAGTTRAISIIRLDGKEGLDSENLQAFGKGLVFQVAGEAAQECIVKPALDHILGSEESLKKDMLNAVATVLIGGVIFSIKYN